MAWDSKFINFGVLKIEKDKVLVHKDQYNHTTISVGKIVTAAQWAGGEINITMTDGKVRRYKDQYNYIII